jgi:hypothetical protein
MALRRCLDCPALVEHGNRCPACFTRWNRERLSTPQQREIRNSRAWRELSEDVRRREPWCRDCRKTGHFIRAAQVHHPDARFQGGELLPPAGELVPLCTKCHSIRTAGERRPVAPDEPDDVQDFGVQRDRPRQLADRPHPQRPAPPEPLVG